MTRVGSLISCAVLGAAFLGCGSNASSGNSGGPANTLDVVPKDSEIAGWKIDTSNSKTAGKAAATATTQLDTEDLIDGASADFFAAPYTPNMFAWQNYVNASVTDAPSGATMTLYVIQMPTAAQASGLYAALRGASLYTRKVGTPEDWTQPSSPLVGTDSRIQDTGDHWWINFHKGNYYVEVSLGPSAGPAPDYTIGDTATKAAAFAFATAVAAKI
jgi:hypothetical protein